MGFDVEDDIADEAGGSFSLESASRDEILEGAYGGGLTSSSAKADFEDPSMRSVRVRTIWIRHDYDGDGIAELQKVILVGREVLSLEPASRIPVACIVPFINTHRHIGMSVADLVFDVQRIKTAMIRSGLDSLYLATNPRHAVDKNTANLADLLVSRPGGVVRVDGIPQQAIMPLPTENTFPYAQQGLLHMDSVVEARVGVNRAFTGISTASIGTDNAYDRIGQLSTMAAQRVEQIARIFANGVERLFSIAHELLIKSGHQGETIQLRGQWIDVDPTQWRTGRDMRVVAPFAAGNKDSLVQRLMVHMQVHEKALAAGAPFVQVDDSYELAKMLASATDISGDKIYTDPATIPPPEPPPDYTMMALEVENKKADNQEADSQRDAALKDKEIDSDEAIRKYQIDTNAQLQLALKEMDTGAKASLEVTKADLRDAPIKEANELGRNANEIASQLSQTVKESIEQMDKAIQDMKAIQSAPVKIVRKNGKIVGKEQGGVFTPVE